MSRIHKCIYIVRKKFDYNIIIAYLHAIIDKYNRTGLTGFVRQNSKIEFIFKKLHIIELYTKKQFNDIGIDYNNYHVHYTNDKITKGNYIRNNIDLTEFDNIVFIDDYDTNISSVNEYNNNILCYKFVIIFNKYLST